MTIAECARAAAAVLIAAGHAPDDSRRDAALLARHLLGWDAAAWLTRQRDETPPWLGAALAALVARRAPGEPIAYLTGEREFYGRTFAVTRDVLIPRPETELAVDVARALIDRHHSEPFRLADVGTGSGCLAVTLAAERAHVRVVATDISAPALAVAGANATRHGVAAAIDFRLTSLLGPDPGPFDLVVSNPPYIAESDRPTLMRDVGDYEPAGALFAGADGLDVIRRLLPEAFTALEPGGALVMEIGAGQFADVARLTAAAGFDKVAPHRDLAGIDRVVSARRPGPSV